MKKFLSSAIILALGLSCTSPLLFSAPKKSTDEIKKEKAAYALFVKKCQEMTYLIKSGKELTKTEAKQLFDDTVKEIDTKLTAILDMIKSGEIKASPKTITKINTLFIKLKATKDEKVYLDTVKKLILVMYNDEMLPKWVKYSLGALLIATTGGALGYAAYLGANVFMVAIYSVGSLWNLVKNGYWTKVIEGAKNFYEMIENALKVSDDLQNNLNTCQAENEGYKTELETCNNDRDAFETNLNTCKSELETCNIGLEECGKKTCPVTDEAVFCPNKGYNICEDWTKEECLDEYNTLKDGCPSKDTVCNGLIDPNTCPEPNYEGYIKEHGYIKTSDCPKPDYKGYIARNGYIKETDCPPCVLTNAELNSQCDTLCQGKSAGCVEGCKIGVKHTIDKFFTPAIQ
ncbi:MAG: hypothetical protein V1855_05190 [bacterium]